LLRQNFGTLAWQIRPWALAHGDSGGSGDGFGGEENLFDLARQAMSKISSKAGAKTLSAAPHSNDAESDLNINGSENEPEEEVIAAKSLIRKHSVDVESPAAAKRRRIDTILEGMARHDKEMSDRPRALCCKLLAECAILLPAVRVHAIQLRMD
jgi:hypothetical protein